MADLSVALSDGACLIGSAPSVSSPDLKSVLITRLSRYYARLGSESSSTHSQSLEDIQYTTAREALAVVIRVQRIIGQDVPTTTERTADIPLIGTRDLAELRTLLSITYKWGLNPLLAKVTLSWPSKAPTQRPRTIDLATATDAYELLRVMISDLLGVIFPGGVDGHVAQSLITTTILERHATDLLRSCLTLGWLPKSLASDVTKPLDIARPLTVRILSLCVYNHQSSLFS